MANDGKTIQLINTSALTIRQTQPSSDRLLCKRLRCRCAQRDDGKEIRHIPAFLQHVDMDDNFDGIIRRFQL